MYRKLGWQSGGAVDLSSPWRRVTFVFTTEPVSAPLSHCLHVFQCPGIICVFQGCSRGWDSHTWWLLLLNSCLQELIVGPGWVTWGDDNWTDTGAGFWSLCSCWGTKHTWETMRKHVTSYLMCSAVWPGRNVGVCAAFSVPACILSHVALLYLRISPIHSDRGIPRHLWWLFHCQGGPGTDISMLNPVVCILSS